MPSVITGIKKNPIIRKLQEKLIEQRIKRLKYSPNDLKKEIEGSLWKDTSEKVQQLKLPKVIELVKDDPDLVKAIWVVTCPEAQKSNAEILPTIIEAVKDDPYLVEDIWQHTDSEVKKVKIAEVIETVKEDLLSVWYIWQYTDSEVKKLKIAEVIEAVKDDPYLVEDIWQHTNSEVKKVKIAEVIEAVKDDPYLVEDIWQHTNSEVKKVKIAEVIEAVKDDPRWVQKIWIHADPEIQKSNAEILSTVIEAVKDDPNLVEKIWVATCPEAQKSNAEILPTVIEAAVKEDLVWYIWQRTDSEVKKLKIAEVIDVVKEDFFTLCDILNDTDPEIKRSKIAEIIDVIKEDRDSLAIIWENTDPEIKRSKMAEIIDVIKDNRDSLALIWGNIDSETQKNKITEIIDLVKDNHKSLVAIWMNTDLEIVIDNFNFFYKLNTGREITDKATSRLQQLSQKNRNILKTIDFVFLDNSKFFDEFTEEQIIRITNYPEVQEFIAKNYNNQIMKNSIQYLLENDINWIISLDKIMKNESQYTWLLNNLSSVDESKITDEFIQQLLCVMSDTENYFEIQNYDDVNNFFYKRNEICLKILKGDTSNIPSPLQKYNDENELYKFALLEYQFGISLDEARKLVERYGSDLDKLQDNTLSDYLKILKATLECKDIKGIVNNAIEKNKLNEPWTGFPNARNAEGQIINLFAELYNETLYKTTENEQDKNTKQEIYVDKDGKEYKINVYTISNDFNMNIRVEGAYSHFVEPQDFREYFELPDISYHGNCECYIGNDSISQARNIGGVAVGYSYIMQNNLIGAMPADICSRDYNVNFSSYSMPSEFRIPQEMINHTRHTHNEMVKDRLLTDENGNVTKYKPNYAVWIEEDTKEERQAKDWQEKREKDPQWIMTKKLAAQLGIPIVVIDREHFAERELDKIELMKNLIAGKEINDERYKEYLEEYSKLSKTELIEQLIIKFENNRTGIQFNKKLDDKYFTQEQLENLIEEINESIENMPKKEAKKCLQKLESVSQKEKLESEDKKAKDFYTKLQQENSEKLERLEVSIEKENELNLFDLMDEIADTHYYDGNKHHSIEHIQKVILFSKVLAEGEHLSEEDRKLLLVSAAFHDSGRSGKDGNDAHARPSAKRAKEELSKKNNYGINNPEEIAIIQTAIHYHEHREKVPGKLDTDEIERLSDIYAKENGIEKIDLKRTMKICELLKDADALDRFRFAKCGRLNSEFLRSETAKSKSTIDYAKNINEQVARKILEEVYEIDEEKIELENAVQMLRDIRIEKQKDEPHLDFKEIYDLSPRTEKQPHDIRKNFLELYLHTGTDAEQVNSLKKEIKEKLALDRHIEDNIQGQEVKE